MQLDSIPVPRFLLARLEGAGVDVDALLRKLGTTRARLEASQARLSTAEYMAFWNSFETIEVPRDFGFRLVETRQPQHYDVASLVALRSRDFAEAIARLARYKRLVCPEEISVTEKGGEARMRYDWFLAEAALPKFLVEATFMANIMLARTGTGQPVSPKRIELTRRRGDVQLLREQFECTVRFDAPCDTIVWDEALLHVPFVTHDPDMANLLLPGLEAALDESPAQRDLVDDVRAALRRAMVGERPSVDKVAATLHVSRRTLQRRLEEASTSYQLLLDEVRQQSAKRLLSTTDLDAGEVAFLLGYEELNSFSRAFHGWEGRTPLQWRSSA
jgi:AraC-like DNA-binding protein